MGMVVSPYALATTASAGKRYWRLITREGGSSSTTLAELEMRIVASGADRTGSGTASASGENVGEEASKAFDNNTGTYWQTGTAGPGIWLKYDFGVGANEEIVEIAMTPLSGFAARMMRLFDVQSSPDNSVWTTEWSVEQPTWTNSQQVFTKPSAGADRRWRLRADTLASGLVMSCAEMELRASLGGADETGSGTASARLTFSGFPASNAFDNNTATLWSGDAPGLDDCEWLAYDFGSGVTKSIVQVSFTARNDGNYTQSPTAGWIESGSDGISWLPRIRFTGLSWSAGATNLIS